MEPAAVSKRSSSCDASYYRRVADAARFTLGALAIAAATASLTTPAGADDRDLLRFDTAKPYLFIIFDTSGSMNLDVNNAAVPANGDDPNSKLFQAKKAVYEVFSPVNDVQFGFATFNQDELRMQAKHWLYSPATSAPPAWPLAYPTANTDQWVFGHHIGATVDLGTAATPTAFAANRTKINRFPKVEIVPVGAPPEVYDAVDSHLATSLYLSQTGAGAGTYRLTVTRPLLRADTTPNALLGQDNLEVALRLEKLSPTAVDYGTTVINFRLIRSFFMSETAGPTGGGGGFNATEINNGYWNQIDSLQSADCGDEHPFSGVGWEGNYDGTFSSSSAGVDVDPNADAYGTCVNRDDPATCKNYKQPTILAAPLPGHPNATPLDVGDVIPLHWNQSNQDEFLSRVNPAHGVSATPDYGVANFFGDLPDATGFLPLKNSGQRPLVGAGVTKLGKSIVDFRCWYMGEGEKCRDADPYPAGGWQRIALDFDDKWGCRRPYLVVVSDGENTCAGENPCADTANLWAKTSLRTWVIAYGQNCAAVGNPLKCMAQNGKGELVCPNNPQNLKDELTEILGKIREETTAFASAAAPTVQVSSADQFFLSSFIPLQGEPVWDGHLDAFLKPVPVDPATRKPDRTRLCSSLPADQQSQCFLWDAGTVLESQVQAAPLGEEFQKRRVFYGREVENGLWTRNRRLLQPTVDTVDPGENQIRHDLWDAFGIPFRPATAASESSAQTIANNVIATTLAMKTGATGDYIMGDIFHSNPVVTGPPGIVDYFRSDETYREFFEKHRHRRKLLYVGTNEGLLHAIDVGIPTVTTSTDFLGRDLNKVRFGNGSGREVFAYMPRAVMPTVRSLTTTTGHEFTVDGTVTVTDAFLDPIHTGVTSADPPDPDEREWRSVVIGGLREGGSSYYALDVTQPDVLATTEGVDFVPQPQNTYVPSCLGGLSDPEHMAAAACGPLPYPAVLWEFNDSIPDVVNGGRVRLDEDRNGEPDLGTTWSQAATGRIRVCEFGAGGGAPCRRDGAKILTKYVAIFGGGMDPQRLNARGNFVYMVDIETGDLLFKRQLNASAPAETAVVDTNQDGYLDRIYIGTTLGTMFRIDMDHPADPDFVIPAIENVSVWDANGITHTVRRVSSDFWLPQPIFVADAVNPRPIFFRPAVLFAPSGGFGTVALAFGTGDRENLWSMDLDSGGALRPGRFFVFMDEFAPFDPSAPVTAPLTEASLQALDDNSPEVAFSTDYLFTRAAGGGRGYAMALDPNERVTSTPVALSGVAVFNTFNPVTTSTASGPPGGPGAIRLCARLGFSRVFVLYTQNGNGLLEDLSFTGGSGGGGIDHGPGEFSLSYRATRYRQRQGLLSTPFSETSSTTNPRASSSDPAASLSTLTEAEARQYQALQTLLFPPECRFSNQRHDIEGVASEVALEKLAALPICIVQRNWKEN